MSNAVTDLDAVVVRAAGRHPDVPVFLLGHSMGATVSLCYALRHEDRLSGLILSGPLAALEVAPALQRIAARALSVLTPGLGIVAIDHEILNEPEQDQVLDDMCAWLAARVAIRI
jgi:acylglycerol lipase